MLLQIAKTQQEQINNMCSDSFKLDIQRDIQTITNIQIDFSLNLNADAKIKCEIIYSFKNLF